LREILDTVVDNGVITGREADAIVDAVRHSDKVVFRLANVLDTLTDKGVLSRDQAAAIVAALHRADWDGFSIDRLGRILAELVRHGVISAAQREAIMDGMRRYRSPRHSRRRPAPGRQRRAESVLCTSRADVALLGGTSIVVGARSE